MSGKMPLTDIQALYSLSPCWPLSNTWFDSQDFQHQLPFWAILPETHTCTKTTVWEFYRNTWLHHFWRNSGSFHVALMSTPLTLIQSYYLYYMSNLETMFWQMPCIFRSLLRMVQKLLTEISIYSAIITIIWQWWVHTSSCNCLVLFCNTEVSPLYFMYMKGKWNAEYVLGKTNLSCHPASGYRNTSLGMFKTWETIFYS